MRVSVLAKAMAMAVLVLSGSLSTALLPAAPASAGEDDDAAARRLAETHAPFIAVRQQREPCDAEGEPYAPAAVDIVLDNPEIVLRDGGGRILAEAPTAADLFDAASDTHLDYPGDSLEPGCTYERDFDRFNDGRRPVVYAHIAREEGRDGLIALQYWTFWYFNDWNNTHETDWEGIQLLFEADTVEEALAVEPIEVAFAQHEGGERRPWDDAGLQRSGDRVTVYASAGSHASYFAPELYLGRSASEGFGCDSTEPPLDELDPEVVVLPDAVDDPTDSLAWLAYEGRWGEKHAGPFNGPTGPTSKDRWAKPVTWQEGLRQSSVTVPGDKTFGPRASDAFCSVAAVGSGLFIAVLESPVVMIGLVVASGLVVGAALRVARPVLREARRLWRGHRGRFAVVGLVFVPVALFTTGVQAVVLGLPGIAPLVELDSGRGFGATSLALAVGAGGGLFTSIVVQAVVAVLLDADRRDQDLGALGAYRVVAGRWRQLGSAAIEMVVVVLALALTVVGLPWAIRQSVRWAFVGPAVITGDLGGRPALRSSSAAVEGRWWQTASTLLVTAGAALAAGPVIGIVLMFVTGLSLGLLNTVSSAIYILTVPVAAIALNLWWQETERRAAVPGMSQRGVVP